MPNIQYFTEYLSKIANSLLLLLGLVFPKYLKFSVATLPAPVVSARDTRFYYVMWSPGGRAGGVGREVIMRGEVWVGYPVIKC